MIKQTSVIELLGTEKRIYRFYFDPKAPLGEAFDVLNKMKMHLMEQMKLQEMRLEKEKKL